MTRRTRSATARKVVGSLGVLGAAAAVAGLGTFGTFTDSTTPVSTQVASGTVNLDLAEDPATIAAPVAQFVPGDRMSRAVTLVNRGDSPMSSVSLTVTQAAGSTLTSALRLSVQSCAQPWTASGAGHTCATGARDVVTRGGVLRSDEPLLTSASLTPGGRDHLVFTIELPNGTGNEFQGKTATLSLTFTGTQRGGTAR
ncbi:TasA family protein [Geodermatophilus sp. SYSU D01105]